MIKILKFWAPWCSKCHILNTGAWEHLKSANPDLEFEDINTDDRADLVKKYNLKNIPVVMVVKDDGEELARIVGIKLLADYQAMIDRNLTPNV